MGLLASVLESDTRTRPQATGTAVTSSCSQWVKGGVDGGDGDLVEWLHLHLSPGRGSESQPRCTRTQLRKLERGLRDCQLTKFCGIGHSSSKGSRKSRRHMLQEITERN